MVVYPQDGDDRLVYRPSTPILARRKIVQRGFRYWHYGQQIAYSQSRPTQLRLPKETTRLDCSGLVAACMDFAGVLPKVDWRYTNTWVQIKLGRAVDLKYAKPGDIVFYGRSTADPTHEALYLGTLADLDALLELDVPQEIRDAMLAVGRGQRCVLSNGHHPMGVYPVDYRRDRVQVRTFL